MLGTRDEGCKIFAGLVKRFGSPLAAIKYLRGKNKLVYDIPLDHKVVIERAIMLIETAWMDEEPMPCEVEARNILKELLK